MQTWRGDQRATAGRRRKSVKERKFKNLEHMIRFAWGQTPKFDGKRTRQESNGNSDEGGTNASFHLSGGFFPSHLRHRISTFFSRCRGSSGLCSPIPPGSQLSLALNNSPYSCLCASWGRLGCSLLPSHCQERTYVPDRLLLQSKHRDSCRGCTQIPPNTQVSCLLSQEERLGRSHEQPPWPSSQPASGTNWAPFTLPAQAAVWHPDPLQWSY